MYQVKWFDSRFYEVLLKDGIDFFPGVTTILNVSPKPYLAKWRGQVGNDEADRVMNEAKYRGTVIHSACEDLVKGAVIVLDCDGHRRLSDDEIVKLGAYRKVVRLKEQEHYYQVLKFAALLDALHPTQITTEQTVFSLEHRFAGTRDYLWHLEAGLYEIDGAKPVRIETGWYIADIKTGNSISDDAFMQIAAYAHADQEMSGLEIKGGIVIHTNSSAKKGIEGLSAKVRTAAELDIDFQNFMKIYDVWKINPTATAPKIFAMPVYVQWSEKKSGMQAVNSFTPSAADIANDDGGAMKLVEKAEAAVELEPAAEPVSEPAAEIVDELPPPAPAKPMPNKAAARSKRAQAGNIYPNQLDPTERTLGRSKPPF